MSSVYNAIALPSYFAGFAGWKCLQGNDKSKDRGPRGPDRGLDLTTTSRLSPTAASSVAAPRPPLPPLRYRTRLFGWLRERISFRTMPQVPPPSRQLASSPRQIRDPHIGGPRQDNLWTCRHSPPARGRG